MSSQKGNVSRSRPQKHKNRTSFKNNLHDTSGRTKFINSINVSDVCVRCKEIIEWKIKYKKYKPLTQPKKCVKCDQKTVKKAYHVMCQDCGTKLGVCTKCCQSKDVVKPEPSEGEQLKLDNEMKVLLQSLPERKRRTFIRYMNKQSKSDTNQADLPDNEREHLIEKLNSLKVDENGDDDFFDDEEDENEEAESDNSDT